MFAEEAGKKLTEVETKIKHCKKCNLSGTCTNYVPGEGNPEAKLLFVGEAPGKNEDLTGRPFCGKAGNILNQLLVEAGKKREDVYIANILKCRPPGNRNPNPEEIRTCTPYLLRQLEIIKPKIICCLGNFSTSFIMSKFNLENKIQAVGKVHGRVFMSPGANFPKIIPLYHPASAIYNPKSIEILKQDFKMLKNIPV